MRGRGAVSLRWGVALTLAGGTAGCRLRHLDLTADRAATISMAGVHTVVITSGAGWLRIQGHPGFPTLQARGIAHASSEKLLAAVRLTVQRSGDSAFVAATAPVDSGSVAGPAVLDLTLDIPSDVALDVTDASGETIIHDVGPLLLATSGSGVEIDGVSGALGIVDGPGDLQASNVHGDVYIRDGGGAIYLSNITGSVDIPVDGSGEIQVADVTGSVHIGAKSSGEVAVRDVGGDLLVDARGSGSVQYHNVRGRVMVPGSR